MSVGAAAALRGTSTVGRRAPRSLGLFSRFSQTPAQFSLSRSLNTSSTTGILRSNSSRLSQSALNRQEARFSTMSPLQAAPVLEREYDPEIKDMADYIHNYKVDSELAVSLSSFHFVFLSD